jgi:tellurite resistance protein
MATEEEDAYFHQLELERREDTRREMARAAEKLQKARAVAKSAGTEDLELADRIAKLGFSGETAKVFDLLPPILVAWADGSVSRDERATIFTVLEHRKIARGSEPFVAVEALLEEKPSQAFIDESMDALRDLMAGRPEASSTEMIELCAAIADASGGFLGLVKRISPEERELVGRIADELGPAAQEQFRKSL